MLELHGKGIKVSIFDEVSDEQTQEMVETTSFCSAAHFENKEKIWK